MKSNQPQRRQFLKIGASALAMIPVMVVAGRSEAATNAAMRSALKYQNKPEGDKSSMSTTLIIGGACLAAIFVAGALNVPPSRRFA